MLEVPEGAKLYRVRIYEGATKLCFMLPEGYPAAMQLYVWMFTDGTCKTEFYPDHHPMEAGMPEGVGQNLACTDIKEHTWTK